MTKKPLLALCLIGLLAISSPAQENMVYKEIDTVQLMLQVYRPATMDTTQTYPAMIFFFGGGWKGGRLEQFEPQAHYFSQRGMVCFLADYRVESRHGTTPFEALMDAKSALRYLRAHAKDLQIDPQKIVASGGSAGGHLAAATALIEAYSDPSDDRSVSAVPNAMVLFNPVIDNGPGGYGHERIGDRYKAFSPLHNIKKGTPPTVIFLGTEDRLIPVETARYYKTVMEKVGSRCDLHLFEGESHGFFNYAQPDNYKETIRRADIFLQSLGYLQALPTNKMD